MKKLLTDCLNVAGGIAAVLLVTALVVIFNPITWLIVIACKL